MNAEQFIQLLVRYVRDTSISGTFSILTNPPGRKPREKHVRISNWLNQLPDEERMIVKQVVEESVDAALFNILCVFDGVKKIEESTGDSQFRLIHEIGQSSECINDPNDEYLHDIYKDVVDSRQSEGS